MAKRARETETPDTDRVAGFAHPRETETLAGQNTALNLVSRALRGGRPPHAWLLCGPPGIGKATLAYRMARYLLRYGASDAGPADLSLPQGDPVAAQVTARAHPGLLVLKRGINPRTGKVQSELPVDEIRRLESFFGMTSGAGGWRVAIIDSADDMNEHAANALLKQLEEPPARAMLILLAHRPGRLLPTIRSRCRRLDLSPLPAAVLDDMLAHLLPDRTREERETLTRLSDGSLGAALTLAQGDGAMLAEAADRLIAEARAPDLVALYALGEKMARIPDGLALFGDFLQQAFVARVRARARTGDSVARWAEASERLEAHFSRASGLNLEARQTLWGAARDLAATTRRAGPLA